jgi:hypothetical protein
MVSCPVCEEFLDPEFINEHLDSNCSLTQNDIEMRREKHRGTKDITAQKKAWASVLNSRSVILVKSRL